MSALCHSARVQIAADLHNIAGELFVDRPRPARTCTQPEVPSCEDEDAKAAEGAEGKEDARAHPRQVASV
jgi:hypothetical protein